MWGKLDKSAALWQQVWRLLLPSVSSPPGPSPIVSVFSLLPVHLKWMELQGQHPSNCPKGGWKMQYDPRMDDGAEDSWAEIRSVIIQKFMLLLINTEIHDLDVEVFLEGGLN